MFFPLVAHLLGGKQVHGYALFNVLIDMYAECGSLNYARLVFGVSYVCKDAIS